MQSDLISRNALKKLVVEPSMYDINTSDVLSLIEEPPAIDAVPVVRCKDCKNRGTPYSCPMRKLVMPWQGAGSYEDCTEDEGFCHMGVKKDGGAKE